MKRNTPRLSNILKFTSRDEKYNRRVILWNQKPWETIVKRKQNKILHKKVRSLCITVFNLFLHAEHLTWIMNHLKFLFFKLFLSWTQRNLLALQFILYRWPWRLVQQGQNTLCPKANGGVWKLALNLFCSFKSMIGWLLLNSNANSKRQSRVQQKFAARWE